MMKTKLHRFAELVLGLARVATILSTGLALAIVVMVISGSAPKWVALALGICVLYAACSVPFTDWARRRIVQD